MRIHRLPVFVIVSLFAPVLLIGQTGTGSQGGSLSIEELYLSQEVEIQILRTQALATTREAKQLALQSIRSMIEEKRVSSDSKEVIAILEALAGEGVYRVSRSNGEIINDFPDIRRDAVNLLGKIGGPTTKSILQKVTLEDREPMVLAEAVYAIGVSSTANDKDVLPYVSKVMIRNNVRPLPDNNLAFACLLSIEKLIDKFGGLGDAEIVNALLDIASGAYLRDVKLKAIEIIGKLRNTKPGA